MNKTLSVSIIAAILALTTLAQWPGGGGGGPGGGGNQPGGGGSASWTFDTFLAASTAASGCILREEVWTGHADPTTVTLTAAVTNIAPGVCSGCTTLKTLDLSATTITAIPDSAFSGCTAITAVEIEQCGQMKIGDGAFQNCTGLKTVSLPEGFTDLGQKVFADDTALAKITLPISLKTIGNGLLSNTASLNVLAFRGTSVQWNAIKKAVGWNAGAGKTAPTAYQAS